MKQNKNNLLVHRYALSSLMLALVVVATLGVVMRAHNATDAAPKPKFATGAAVKSQFSFTGLPGWWQGATNKTSMALFQNSRSCFTSAQYSTGTVNVSAAVDQYQANLTSAGYTITPEPMQTLVLQTSAGGQQYQLQQYSVSGSGSAGTVEGGQEIGYLQLNGGYIKLIGDCDTAAELPPTIQALQAIKFDVAS